MTFHDGEPFNAEAVCFNFERWFNFPASLQGEGTTYYWQFGFGGGFKNPAEGSTGPEDSLYKSCEAVDESTVTLNLTKPSATILSTLTLPSIHIVSPTALTEFEADAGATERRRRLHALRHVLHRAPDGHRAVQVRVLDRRRAARPRPQRRLLGRAGADREDHLPPDRRQRGSSPGAADGRDPGLRPRRAPGRPDDRGRRQPAAARPSAVQRRLGHDQPREAADGQARGAAGDLARDQPRGARRLLLRRPRRRRDAVHAAGDHRLR